MILLAGWLLIGRTPDVHYHLQLLYCSLCSVGLTRELAGSLGEYAEIDCCVQPFYSTERITELVKDVEQDLQKLLGEEQGEHPMVSVPELQTVERMYTNSQVPTQAVKAGSA